MAIVKEIEEGRHIVTPEEAPLYSVCSCESSEHRFCLRALRPGERTCSFSLSVSPRLWSSMQTHAVDLLLARNDQGQIPDHQRGIPVVDQADYLEPPAPHAKAAEEERYEL